MKRARTSETETSVPSTKDDGSLLIGLLVSKFDRDNVTFDTTKILDLCNPQLKEAVALKDKFEEPGLLASFSDFQSRMLAISDDLGRDDKQERAILTETFYVDFHKPDFLGFISSHLDLNTTIMIMAKDQKDKDELVESGFTKSKYGDGALFTKRYSFFQKASFREGPESMHSSDTAKAMIVSSTYPSIEIHLAVVSLG